MTAPAQTVARPTSDPGWWTLHRGGSFALEDTEGRPVAIRGRKAKAVIAYLAVHAGERVSRDKLIKLLWADRGEVQARGSLRQCLLEIRRAAPDLIGSDHDHLWIDPARVQFSGRGGSSSTDAELFDDLDGSTPEFDDWLRSERSDQAEAECESLRREAEELLRQQKGAAAIPLTERMQRLDPYNEDWLRLAMRAEAQAGRPAGVQRRFHEMADLLRQELGVPISAQSRALHDELLAELARPPAPRVPIGIALAETVEPHPLRTAASKSRRRWAPLAGLAAMATALGLSHSAVPASADPTRIAVLPFRAMGGADPALADGMAEEVLTALAQQRGLHTIGRTSSWMFKDKAEDLRQVGRKLKVDYVVEGSARRVGDALRVTVSLVDTKDGSTIWSGRFTSSTGDAQRIEDAAANAILQRLGFQATGSDRRTDPRVYAMYVRAKALIRDRDWEKIWEARDLLQQAVRIDPEFAPAWAQLGIALYFTGPTKVAPVDGDLQAGENEALASARRAIALDPRLAEAHQTMGFLLGSDTAEGRAHLRQALRLDPRNPQTAYWWASALGAAGNFALQEKAVRYAMALDPLWKRPVEVVSSHALFAGRRSEAYGHVERLRAADPEAALEVELSLLHQEGDLSRVVELGRAQPNIKLVQDSDAKASLAWSLNEMGYVRESLLIGGASPFERLVSLRRLPDRRTILAETRQFVGAPDEQWALKPLLLELARTGRNADIAALFDRRGSRLNRLQLIEHGNREHRATLAALLGKALLDLGRRREAAQLFRAADEAVRVILANGNVPPAMFADMAVSESILGRRARAVGLLEQAVATGWFAFEGLNYRLDEMPGLSSLRGDPRFDRLVRITNARREKERRETAALNLI